MFNLMALVASYHATMALWPSRRPCRPTSRRQLFHRNHLIACTVIRHLATSRCLSRNRINNIHNSSRVASDADQEMRSTLYTSGRPSASIGTARRTRILRKTKVVSGDDQSLRMPLSIVSC